MRATAGCRRPSATSAHAPADEREPKAPVVDARADRQPERRRRAGAHDGRSRPRPGRSLCGRGRARPPRRTARRGARRSSCAPRSQTQGRGESTPPAPARSGSAGPESGSRGAVPVRRRTSARPTLLGEAEAAPDLPPEGRHGEVGVGFRPAGGASRAGRRRREAAAPERRRARLPRAPRPFRAAPGADDDGPCLLRTHSGPVLRAAVDDQDLRTRKVPVERRGPSRRCTLLRRARRRGW